jgi:hypothetical protein
MLARVFPRKTRATPDDVIRFNQGAGAGLEAPAKIMDAPGVDL